MSQRSLVCVIDDDEGIRLSLSSLLQSAGFDVRVFASPSAYLESELASGCGCLVLDVRLDGEDGLDFQEALLREHSTTPIVLITGHADVPMTVRAMRAGALNFLTKPFSDTDIISAVCEAIDRDSQRRAALSKSENLRERYETLRPREREVMALVVSGLMNKHIAAQLAISEVTVKIHRGRTMSKMRARSVAELVRLANAIGLFQPDGRQLSE